MTLKKVGTMYSLNKQRSRTYRYSTLLMKICPNSIRSSKFKGSNINYAVAAGWLHNFSYYYYLFM